MAYFSALLFCLVRDERGSPVEFRWSDCVRRARIEENFNTYEKLMKRCLGILLLVTLPFVTTGLLAQALRTGDTNSTSNAHVQPVKKHHKHKHHKPPKHNA